MKTKDFTEDVKLKCLLWSYRHCCLCGKACGMDIEIAHIDKREGGGRKIDNAIPLCYNCHADVGRYNRAHPRGNEYRFEELKRRREQVYEEHTRHLVPPIDYQVTQDIVLPDGGIVKRKLPDVGFNIAHLGDSLPVRVRVEAKVLLGEKDLGMLEGDYGGKTLWNLNPRLVIKGHFDLPEGTKESKEIIQVNVRITIVDELEREHRLLPLGWVYKSERNSWVFKPEVDLSTFSKQSEELQSASMKFEEDGSFGTD